MKLHFLSLEPWAVRSGLGLGSLASMVSLLVFIKKSPSSLVSKKIRRRFPQGPTTYTSTPIQESAPNVQGTKSDGKETGTHITGLNQKEEMTIQPEQNEKRRIQKNEERLRNLQDNFKCSNV